MGKKISASKRHRKKRNWAKTTTTVLTTIFIALLFAGAGAATFVYNKYGKDLPDITHLGEYEPSLVTRVYDNKDSLITEFYIEKRILLSFDEIPMMLRVAAVAVEDTGFYEHHGLNLEGIVRAMIANMKAGKVVQGGSSITQQVAKLLFLSPERTFERKLKEAFLSIKIDSAFSKNQILEIYLNHIYYGHGAYGVEAAALTYFGKHVSELSLAQMALISGLPKAPTHYSPYNNMKKSAKRRGHTLRRLVAVGAITHTQMEDANNEPIVLSGRKKVKNKAPWFAEYVRRYLEKKFGAERLYRGGLTVRTTLDLTLQGYAVDAVKAGLEKTDKRLGYHGPLAQINLDAGATPDWTTLNPKMDQNRNVIDVYKPGNKIKGLVTAVSKELVEVRFEDGAGFIELKNMAWAHKVNPKRNARFWPKIKDASKAVAVGDIILVKILEQAKGPDGVLPLALEQEPHVQGALMAIDPRTGYIRAMVGGYDPETTKFNRAVQAHRQPGSSFKPIIYSAALETGQTPATITIDSPIIFDRAVTNFKGWKPTNFEEKFFGPTTMRNAVTHSRNVVTIKTLQEVGISYVIKIARKFGITGKLEPNLSLALGASPLTLKEMVSAYGVLANGGMLAKRMYIKSVEDRNGEFLVKNEPEFERAISPSVAYLMTNIMKNVVAEGTARSVRIGRPVAGKTGTTNNYIDTWFIGFTPEISCGIWVGKDDNSTLGKKETGSRAAAPIWSAFMKKAVKGTPKNDFKPPPDIVFERIDKFSGLLTQSTGKDSIFEAFIDGSEPQESVSDGAGQSDGDDRL